MRTGKILQNRRPGPLRAPGTLRAPIVTPSFALRAIRRMLLAMLATLPLAILARLVAQKTESDLIGFVAAGLAFLIAISFRSLWLPRRGSAAQR
jgi:hypothetical protein